MSNQVPIQPPDFVWYFNVMQTSTLQPKQAWLTWPIDAPFRVTDYRSKMTAAANFETTDLAVSQRVQSIAFNDADASQWMNLNQPADFK